MCSATVDLFSSALKDIRVPLDEEQLGEILVSIIPGGRIMPPAITGTDSPYSMAQSNEGVEGLLTEVLSQATTLRLCTLKPFVCTYRPR